MIYLAIAFVMFFGVVNYDILNRSIGRKLLYVLLFIALTLLLGLRFRVGGDALAYEESHPSMPTFSDLYRFGFYYSDAFLQYQPFWMLLVAFSKSIGKEFYIFQLVHAFIVNSLLFIYVIKNSKKPFSIIFFLFITHYYFYLTIEIEREILAVVIFLFNIKNLEEKKWLKYYALALLSIMFHISASFLLILPLFIYIKIPRKVIFVIVVILLPLMFYKTAFVQFLTPLLFLDSMQSKIALYEEVELSIYGTLFFLLNRVLFFLPILFFVVGSNYYNKKTWLFNAYVIVSVFSLVLVGFERFFNYMIIPYLIIFVDIIYHQERIKKAKIFKYALITFTFLNIFFSIPYRIFTTNKAGDRYSSLFFPYVSIFEKKVIMEREMYIIHQWDLR